MNCTNCGASNQPGDEFCGNCGQPLMAGAGAAAGGGTGAGAGAAAGGSIAPEIICWNCSRRNPPGRAFCIQCGEKLTTGAGAAAGGAAGAAGGSQVTGPGASAVYGGGNGGDGNRRAFLIGGALVVALLLVVAGVVGFNLLNGNAPGASATPTAIAGASETPTLDASPSTSPSTSSPSLAPSLSPGVTAPPPSLPPPDRTPRPTRSPRPTNPPTPEPTPANCDSSTAPSRTRTFDLVENNTWTLDPDRIWCVHEITFTMIQGDGVLKLFLTNPVFLEPEWGYNMEEIGWYEADMPFNFQGSTEYTPTEYNTLPFPMLPQGTTIDFRINCEGTIGTSCGSGTVEIAYENPFAPLLNP